MSFSISQLWLVPGLPFFAAGISALLPAQWGRSRPADRHTRPGHSVQPTNKIPSLLAILALAGSLLLSCRALAAAIGDPAQHAVLNFVWFDLGTGALSLGWILDPLSALMAVMVSFVGLLIFVFSLGYMKEDANAARFFCFLSLFAGAMLGLVVANSLLLLFIFWELVGLASYLLIGFWFERPEAAAAAKKAFLTTRIGDLGLLLGLCWLYRSAGTSLFYDNGQGCLETGPLAAIAGEALAGGLAVSTAIGLLIFCGAMGKSGQFPLHVWLPDAMEGPTPVSALIHAATMVAAGVFLIARVYPLMQADQALAHVPLHALTVVAFVGAITALLGALIAVAQSDIKRVLAFSTVSQLGYMMLALGVGSWIAAMFHLLTHAFFKALLFLGAGSVIHATHHEQDMRRLGGLAGSMRVTAIVFAIGSMALAGIPFFSGFWSKEAILLAAGEWNVSLIPFAAALIAVALTAFYVTRLCGEVFFGPPRTDAAAHAHESPRVMTLPLSVLAVFAVGAGFLGTPAWPWLQSMLAGHAVEHGSLIESVPHFVGSVVLIALGVLIGWILYVRHPRGASAQPDPVQAVAPRLFAFLGARLKLDELYAATLGRLFRGAAVLCAGLDRLVLEALVAGIGRAFQKWGQLNRRGDERGLNAGFNAASEQLRGEGQRYSRAQTGDAHGYLRAVAAAFVLLLLLAYLKGGR